MIALLAARWFTNERQIDLQLIKDTLEQSSIGLLLQAQIGPDF